MCQTTEILKKHPVYATLMEFLKEKTVVLEATGGLELACVAELMQAGLPVAVVNPGRIRGFARSIGQLAKTDKLDAMGAVGIARAFISAGERGG